MIDRYNPDLAPDSRQWLSLDESERLLLVQHFHRDARIPLPKAAREIHAAIHVTVENQLAMEDQEMVRATLRRLMDQGLTRHEAVHAIGSVLAEHIYGLLQEDQDSAADNAAYEAALAQLTADKWRHG